MQNQQWTPVGVAYNKYEILFTVYRNNAKPQWFKARPGTEQNPAFGFDGSIIGLVECVQCMGLHRFQLNQPSPLPADTAKPVSANPDARKP